MIFVMIFIYHLWTKMFLFPQYLNLKVTSLSRAKLSKKINNPQKANESTFHSTNDVLSY